MEYKNKLLNKIQEEYKSLLIRYQSTILKENTDSNSILRVIDEVRIFWYKKLNIIDFVIDKEFKTTENLLLTGAVYLDTKESEHYHFKLFGDYHVVDDPILKMESFFRVSADKDQRTTDVFKRAYRDTLDVVNNYRESIYILPVNALLSKYDKDINDILKEFFWRFMSTALNTKIESDKDFHEKFKSISKVEENIDGFILDNLVYIDSTDSRLSLKERCERYQKEYSHFNNLSLTEIFIIATYSYIAQTIDILLTSSSLGFTPYIRHDVTFRYFLLLKDTFVEDENIKKLIEKTIIYYIMYNTIPLSVLTTISYDELYSRLNNTKLLDKVLERLRDLDIEILYGEVETIKKVIREEVDNIIESH
ncbi:hypothetical protein MUN89_02475 [Halobacillus salinarum]|uniref:Phage protein n=1 Tax=Halobacillus salinarum TaxID=2932257 RepID=A0ABY4ELH9_9BACI|nr:hypothetical protein [Halobacillus salinarum]UOQ44840.1 hypothetical protein MUN89_02475 [Halobacillus salinarum]